MKGALSAILIALIIVLAALFFIKKSGPTTDIPEVTELAIVSSIPAEASMLCMAPSVSELFKTLNLTDKEIFGFPLEETVEEMTDEIGVNLFDIEELKKMGIDTEKEIGFYSTDFQFSDNPKFSMTLFLPCSKDVSLVDTLINKLKEEDIKVTEKENYKLLTDSYDDFAAAIAKVGNYYFITFGTGAERVEKEINLTLTGKEKLGSTENYTSAIKGLKKNGSLFCYINMSTLADAYKDFMTTLSSSRYSSFPTTVNYEKLKSLFTTYKGFALWVDVTEKDFVITSAGQLDLTTKMASYFKSNTIACPIYNITKKPVLAFSAAFDYTPYIKDYLEIYGVTDSMVDDALTEVAEELGIDLKKTVYNNLGEHFGLAVYDAQTINVGTYNALISIQLKDEALGNELRKGVAKKINEQFKEMGGLSQMASVEEVTIEGVPTTKVFFPMAGKLFIGIHNKTLLVSSERSLYKEAITGSNKTGFIKDMKDENLKAAFSQESNSVFYLDINDVCTIVNNFSSTIAMTMSTFDPQGASGIDKTITKVTEAVKKIQYTVGYSQLSKDMFTSEARVQTSFEKPFLEGCVDLGKEVKTIIDEN